MLRAGFKTWENCDVTAFDGNERPRHKKKIIHGDELSWANTVGCPLLREWNLHGWSGNVCVRAATLTEVYGGLEMNLLHNLRYDVVYFRWDLPLFWRNLVLSPRKKGATSPQKVPNFLIEYTESRPRICIQNRMRCDKLKPCKDFSTFCFQIVVNIVDERSL